MRFMRSLCLCIWVSGFFAALTLAAQEIAPVAEIQVQELAQAQAPHEVPRVALLLDATLGDGFDFPAGDVNGKGSYRDKVTRRYHQGWSVAPVPPDAGASADASFQGETWNGQGGGATDAGQPVYAIGSGTVRSIDGTLDGVVIEIEHRFLENGMLRTAVSRYQGVADVALKPGDPVKRRQQIGVIARGVGDAPTELKLGIQVETAGTPSLLAPSAFIRERRKLLVPAREPEIFIAMKRDYRLYLFRKGKLVNSFPIALSQDPMGPKTREGDNRTPEGEYRITQKAKGPFGGEYGDYLGKAWIRISYPNAYDARLALADGRITESQCNAIVSATNARKMPPAKTSLGGGVGIHGWASDWPEGPQHLTWGCLSLREADLMALYDLMPQGAVILMHP